MKKPTCAALEHAVDTAVDECKALGYNSVRFRTMRAQYGTVETIRSIFLLRPASHAGKQWITENLAPTAESWQWLNEALSVEPRYVADIVQGAIDDGLEVQ